MGAGGGGGGCTAGGASEVDSEVTSLRWPVLHQQPPRSAERGIVGGGVGGGVCCGDLRRVACVVTQLVTSHLFFFFS